MRELLIGCGNNLDKKVWLSNESGQFQNVIGLDIDPSSKAHVIWDLEKLPYPFQDEEFDEIHAYEVLEHTGQQGDYKFFFSQFNEFYRILKPKGKMYITVPWWESIWAWGDPGHKRVLSEASFVFLSQAAYKEQVGITAMTDYRNLYHGNFNTLVCEKQKDNQLIVILEKDYAYQ